MAESMPDKRLAQLRHYAATGNLGRSEAEELVAEVTRLLAVETKLRATIAGEHTRLSRELENEEESKALRIELGAAREHAQTVHDQTAELGGHVVQLRAELAEVREAHQLSEAQLIEVTLERAEWRKQVQAHETVAKILRADLVAANERAEEADAAERKLAESLDALTVAAELIDRLAFDDECDYDHHDNCRTHSLQRRPCPHPLGRQFVEAWRAAEAEQQKAADDDHQ